MDNFDNTNQVNSIQHTIIDEHINTDDSTSTNEILPYHKSKKRLFIALGSIVIIGIIAILTTLLVLKMATPSRNTILQAHIGEDGTAHFVTSDGKHITIEEKVTQAFMTPDRKHIVAELKNGSLILQNPQNGKVTYVDTPSADSLYIAAITDNGLWYRWRKGDSSGMARLLFDSKVQYELPLKGIEDVAFAENSLTILYSTAKGEVFVLAEAEDEAVEIGDIGEAEYVYVNGVSADGKMAVWISGKNWAECSTTIYDNGETSTIKGEHGGMVSPDAVFVSMEGGDNGVYVKKSGEPLLHFNVSGAIDDYCMYTDRGEFVDEYYNNGLSKADAYYAFIEGDNMWALYYLSMDGDYERISSDITYYHIYKNTIIYVEWDYQDDIGTLYQAKLDGAVLSDITTIAKNIDDDDFYAKGKYVYYDRNDALYCYRIGDKESVKVTGLDINPNLYLGEDGSSVLFVANEIYIGTTYKRYGDLMKWSWGDESTTKISGDVMSPSFSEAAITNGQPYGCIDTEKFAFERYVSLTSDESVLVDVVYYNGKDTNTLVHNVYRLDD